MEKKRLIAQTDPWVLIITLATLGSLFLSSLEVVITGKSLIFGKKTRKVPT